MDTTVEMQPSDDRAIDTAAGVAARRASTVAQRGDALVVVDVQNDFLPGGALPVPDADQVIPVLNRYLQRFASRSLPVVASRDWHPPDHCSFRQQGGPWPSHCVAQTGGAQFAPRLALPPSAIVVSKATTPQIESYSDFQGTDLRQRLQALGVERLFVGGLATEYCVLATVQDALACGFKVVLLSDAIRAIDARPGDGQRAVAEMIRRGAVPLRWEELA
jgi:nicotinamidase/pyrazinamidase